MWGKVTETAGIFWDAGQDVDSLFHFPSAFMHSTIACLRFLSSSLSLFPAEPSAWNHICFFFYFFFLFFFGITVLSCTGEVRGELQFCMILTQNSCDDIHLYREKC